MGRIHHKAAHHHGDEQRRSSRREERQGDSRSWSRAAYNGTVNKGLKDDDEHAPERTVSGEAVGTGESY